MSRPAELNHKEIPRKIIGATAGGFLTQPVTDETEAIRRLRQAELDRNDNREELERQHGQVWDHEELRVAFEVMGFMSPFVVAKRKADGIRGSLEFQHHPRFYFNWMSTTEQG